MTGVCSHETLQAIGTPLHLLCRFDIDVLDADTGRGTAVMAMSLAGLVNPFTGLPTVGPLAILVDAVGGLVNHLRRDDDQWTVSSELAFELSSSANGRTLMEAGVPVIVTAATLGPKENSSLALCTLTCEGAAIGTATVRSYFVGTDDLVLAEPDETVSRTPRVGLADLMALRTEEGIGAPRVLHQHGDPILINALGFVNGGVAAAGLELAASAAVNTEGQTLHTATLRVNFLRPFIAGQNSRYEATPMRIGRGTAVADAQAIADDGRVALAARVTAYR
jgi:uncharacterized protein (TIGR00369 family)